MTIIVVKKPKKKAKQRSMSNKEISRRSGNTKTISKDDNFASKVRNMELAAYNRERGKVVRKIQKRTRKQQ